MPDGTYVVGSQCRCDAGAVRAYCMVDASIMWTIATLDCPTYLIIDETKSKRVAPIVHSIKGL
eukprot:scaffold2032_cov122-Cylindrotheca_fusiformis.AAC.6